MASDPIKLEEWLTDLKTLPIGTREVHTVSKKTKKNFHNLMYLLFQRAVAWKLLDYHGNPMTLVRVQRG
jgi:hypothetical protein